MHIFKRYHICVYAYYVYIVCDTITISVAIVAQGLVWPRL